MSIPIPYAGNYTAFVGGVVFKAVVCEHCRVEYVYRLECTAKGKATSYLFLDNKGAAARAAERAESSLQRKFERGDMVPCPLCGWYQANMLLMARKAYHRWMFNTGICLAFSSIPVAILGSVANSIERRTPVIPWPVFLAVVVAMAALGIGLIAGKFILASLYDLNNQEVGIRKRLGQSRSMLRHEFEQRGWQIYSPSQLVEETVSPSQLVEAAVSLSPVGGKAASECLCSICGVRLRGGERNAGLCTPCQRKVEGK